MPYPGNFNPEWGYLAPGPSIIRTVRMVVLAGAIGTVAGMAVTIALVARPAAEVSVAARTLAQPSVSDALPKSASAFDAEPLQNSAQHVAAPPQQLPAHSSVDHRGLKDLAAADSRSATTVQRPASIAALAEAPALTDNAAEAPRGAPSVSVPRRVSKKEQIARIRTPRSDQGSPDDDNRGPFEFFPLIGRTIIGANPFWNEQVR